jgi:hypothetical protein
MYEEIFKQNKNKCPWRTKGSYFYECGGSYNGNNYLNRKQCKFKNCPVAFWLVEFKAGGWL